MKKLFLSVCVTVVGMGSFASTASAAEPRSQFYDFTKQLIDGQVRRPTSLYTNTRQEAKFNRLLELKKELLPNVHASRQQPVFK